jgi:UDP-galactopyranose mutase
VKIAVVGAGLYGSTVAHLLKNSHTVHVYEQSQHIGGNVRSYYDEAIGCHVSEHGAHIFHTNSKEIWDFVNQFTAFNSYQHYVKGLTSSGRIIDLPFGMSMFSQVLGLNTPSEARRYFNQLHGGQDLNALDIESWCMKNIGETLYRTAVKDYTEKQWGRPCSDLSSDIIKRLPLRFSYDSTYFNNAKYQGMPVCGYQHIIESMLSDVPLFLGNDVGSREIEDLDKNYDCVFFSGALDSLFEYCLGELPYRGLKFVDTYCSTDEGTGAPVINDLTVAKHTRKIDHKMFYPDLKDTGTRLITTEFPAPWVRGQHRYYPVRDNDSSTLYAKYKELAESKLPNTIVGGRLGAFRYYDMDQVIGMAMADARKVTS